VNIGRLAQIVCDKTGKFSRDTRDTDRDRHFFEGQSVRLSQRSGCDQFGVNEMVACWALETGNIYYGFTKKGRQDDKAQMRHDY
jgi:hypothetical protein